MDAVEAAPSSRQERAVKFRPGGGFYTDDNPLALLGKCHGVGRQNAFVPAAVTDIQYEHENFPYLVLNKSHAAYLAEIAGALAAGCTVLRRTGGDLRPEYMRRNLDGVRPRSCRGAGAGRRLARTGCMGGRPSRDE